MRTNNRRVNAVLSSADPHTSENAPPGFLQAPEHYGRPRTWPCSRPRSSPGSTVDWDWSPGHAPVGHERFLYSRSDWKKEDKREEWLESKKMDSLEGKKDKSRSRLGWRESKREGGYDRTNMIYRIQTSQNIPKLNQSLFCGSVCLSVKAKLNKETNAGRGKLQRRASEPNSLEFQLQWS